MSTVLIPQGHVYVQWNCMSMCFVLILTCWFLAKKNSSFIILKNHSWEFANTNPMLQHAHKLQLLCTLSQCNTHGLNSRQCSDFLGAWTPTCHCPTKCTGTHHPTCALHYIACISIIHYHIFLLPHYMSMYCVPLQISSHPPHCFPMLLTRI